MPQSLSRVYTHIIFSTKHRKNLFGDPIEIDLYNDICKELECNPVQVGGHQNHNHLKGLIFYKTRPMTFFLTPNGYA